MNQSPSRFRPRSPRSRCHRTIERGTWRAWRKLTADSAYERAAELGASVLGLVSHANFPTITGRPDEAIILAQQAVELSPLEPTVHNELAWALQGAERYEEALARFEISMAIDSTFYQTHWLLMQVHMWMGNAEAAWAELEWVEAHGGARIPKHVGYMLAVTGRSAEAREILDELTRQAEAGEEPRFGDRALIHVGLGEYEAALELLEQGLEAGEGEITLKANRYWDPLRSDPRFRELLRRMGFAE